MKLITEKNSKILIIIGVLLVFAGLVLFLISAQFDINGEIDTSRFSEFGDYFGGVIGAIWSLAGVILFYVALQEQRKDITINQNALIQQIKEFELQRVELSETREVFKEQSETLKIQRFENTFFQLLNLYNEIISNLQLSVHNEAKEKRDVFSLSTKLLKSAFEGYLNKYENDGFGGYYLSETIEINDFKEVEPYIKSAYINFYYNTSGQKLSNYFRTVYHIFKFIHKSHLLDNDSKQFYASIFRAQLSSDELFLIFYNSIQDNLGYPKMLYLMKRFEVLENFDLGLITIFKYHFELFNYKLDQIEDTEV